MNIRGILGILEKFQCSLPALNIKYNCALFLCQMYWPFVHASKYIFP